MIGQTATERLMAFGIVLPEASEPAAKYANFVQVNGLLFLSGKGPPAIRRASWAKISRPRKGIGSPGWPESKRSPCCNPL
ncbi:RidA family protein [Cohnella cholangitidis]|uniref:hypothetical protein n=1 Tax=Cohnella cholangitidis TaxID=2598458 RepID=UPI002D21E39F|nr:hypothetical protein [Cohnella cholangitidis]